MVGVLVNTVAVIFGSLIGLACKKIINDKIETSLMQVLGVLVVIIGIIDAINPVGTQGILVMLLSFVIGGFIGSALNIQNGLDKLALSVQKLFNKKGVNGENSTRKTNNFTEGFVQATIVFCVGAMVIYGSISAGLGDNKTLYIKSVLDGVVAMLLTVKYGPSVMLSAIPVFVIQGAFSLLASSLGNFLLQSVNFRQELSAIGGVFVFMIGINLLEIKKIPVANYLPALLGACYFLF